MKLITDSCCDLADELIQENDISIVPLNIFLGKNSYKDGIELSHQQFYEFLLTHDELPKTACPSPKEFLDEYRKAKDDIVVVTISTKLSSSYQSALMAKEMFMQEQDQYKVHVINSLNASLGEGMVALKIAQLIKEGCTMEEIKEKSFEIVSNSHSIFTLDSLKYIVKGGRLPKFQGAIATALSIKPILISNGEGEPIIDQKVRGRKIALKKMITLLEEKIKRPQDHILLLGHSQCEEEIEQFKGKIEEKFNFKEIHLCSIGPTIGTYTGKGCIFIAI